MDDPLDPARRAELDRRARALGREARAAFDAGDLDGAHRLQLERLGLNQRLGDEDGIATTLYEMGCIEVRIGRLTDAANHLGESFDRFMGTRRADGIAVSAYQLAVVLVGLGRTAEAVPAYVEARDAFAFLGHNDRVRQIEATLAAIGVGDA